LDEPVTRGFRAAALASAVLLAARLYAADRLGFGDAEALYACYAMHPQAVYVDHPGLVGVVARMIGNGGPPSPAAAHTATAALATLVPWIAAFAARAAGASWGGSAIAALCLIVTPQIAIGTFGMTPDLILIVLWYCAIGFAAGALRARPGSILALTSTLAAGATAGLAFDAKVTGALLFVGIALGFSTKRARPHLRTLAPWAAIAVFSILVSPVVIEEMRRGFPMLRHRLVDTQHAAGPSIRNLGALVGGQLLYIGPPLLLGALLIVRDLGRRRRDDEIAGLLFWVTAACAPLVILMLVSRVAEPHWLAPINLALPLWLALRPDVASARLARAATWFGACGIALVHLWVLWPVGPRLLGRRYQARYDIANDLYAWKTGLALARRSIAESLDSSGSAPVVVGPHYTICAQLHAGLGPSVLVGCDDDGPAGDDFADWLPRSTWQRAPVVLYVTDDRFAARDPSMPDRTVDGVWGSAVTRAGVVVRRLRVQRMVPRARAAVPSIGVGAPRPL
jgi:hypothetical protein